MSNKIQRFKDRAKVLESKEKEVSKYERIYDELFEGKIVSIEAVGENEEMNDSYFSDKFYDENDFSRYIEDEEKEENQSLPKYSPIIFNNHPYYKVDEFEGIGTDEETRIEEEKRGVNQSQEKELSEYSKAIN